MAEHASDHTRGEMNIQEQTKSFQLFVGMTKWGSLYLAAALLFLVLWFCTDAGFVGGAVAGVVLAVLGTLVLADRKTAAAH
jgi:hypothetical protein